MTNSSPPTTSLASRVDGTLWGVLVRSAYSAARIRSLDCSAALRMSGVRAVVTQQDVLGFRYYGVERADQPVFAHDVVRYHGEPIAAVAADDPDTARQAAHAILVDYEPLEAVTDPEKAFVAPLLHPEGNVIRHLAISRGEQDIAGAIVVEGLYDVAPCALASAGTAFGVAIPVGDGVELRMPTSWPQRDRDMVAQCLALSPDLVRLCPAEIPGASAAYSDVGLHIQLGLLALHTQRPVTMIAAVGDRVSHHPALMHYRHYADAEGRLLAVEATILLDSGAYAVSSAAVLGTACSLATGPYWAPRARIEGYAVRTNNPPAGMARGAGALQVCLAYEAQMDKLAAVLDLDPVELRARNALTVGDQLATGQVITGAAPVAEVIRACDAAPLPSGEEAEAPSVRRGVGFAVGFTHLLRAEGQVGEATAAVRLTDGVATVTCAGVETGQGFAELAERLVREVLGVERVTLALAGAEHRCPGPLASGCQTWIIGGAIERAARDVRAQLLAPVAGRHGMTPELLDIRDGRVVSYDGLVDIPLAEVTAGQTFYVEAEFTHPETTPLNENGQGHPHVAHAFAAHRAVVDVDIESGLVRVREVVTAQDVGRVINPERVSACLDTGITEGVRMAIAGECLAGSESAPAIRVAALVEEPEPDAPFGAKAVSHPPVISSTAAVVAAVRAATGLELASIPIRSEDIAVSPVEEKRE